MDPGNGEEEAEVEDVDNVKRRKRTRKVKSAPQVVDCDDPSIPPLDKQNGSQDEQKFNTDPSAGAASEEGNGVHPMQDVVQYVPPTDIEMGGTTEGEDRENVTDGNGKLTLLCMCIFAN